MPRQFGLMQRDGVGEGTVAVSAWTLPPAVSSEECIAILTTLGFRLVEEDANIGWVERGGARVGIPLGGIISPDNLLRILEVARISSYRFAEALEQLPPSAVDEGRPRDWMGPPAAERSGTRLAYRTMPERPEREGVRSARARRR